MVRSAEPCLRTFVSVHGVGCSAEWMEKNEFVFTQGAGVLLHVAKQFRPDLLHSSRFCFGALLLDTPKLVTAHNDVLSWADACSLRGWKGPDGFDSTGYW